MHHLLLLVQELLHIHLAVTLAQLLEAATLLLLQDRQIHIKTVMTSPSARI